jgi:hypothetical protein
VSRRYRASQGQRTLDDPPVPPEARPGLDAPARDTVLDPAPGARLAAAAVVVPFVGMQLRGPSARSAAAPGPDRRDGVEQRLEHPAVVDVRRRQRDRERDALPVDEDVVLRSRLALVGRVRADDASPFFAAKLLESRAARVQSMRPAAAKRSSMTWWSRRHTPRRCHSRSRRQHGTP